MERRIEKFNTMRISYKGVIYPNPYDIKFFNDCEYPYGTIEVIDVGGGKYLFLPTVESAPPPEQEGDGKWICHRDDNIAYESEDEAFGYLITETRF